ncbi:MAG: hypothetical protein RIE53_01950 [Rhodothermales bacterium]
MNQDLSTQETAVIATFSSRHDAEIAREYLLDEGIASFFSADDAGGMHPMMQRSQGVDLLALDDVVERARELLDEADLLEGSREDMNEWDPDDPVATATPWSAARFVLLLLGVVAAIMLVRMFMV